MGDPSKWAREKRAEAAGHGYQMPAEVDTSVPSIARIYDYALGGKDNFEVDRRALDHIIRENGDEVVSLARINRAFLQRGVRHLAEEAGIDQFIDVGSGLPTAENVHQVVQRYRPGAHVVYVDKDPIVLAHARALLSDDRTTTVIQADAADPAAILDHPETRRLIDFDRPWALVMVALLHHLTDAQDPVRVVGTFKDRMVPGSYLLTCNLLSDDNEQAKELEVSVQQHARTGIFRPWPVHRAYFDGLEMVDPGLVYAADWPSPCVTEDRDNSWLTILLGGLGRKP